MQKRWVGSMQKRWVGSMQKRWVGEYAKTLGGGEYAKTVDVWETVAKCCHRRFCETFFQKV